MEFCPPPPPPPVPCPGLEDRCILGSPGLALSIQPLFVL